MTSGAAVASDVRAVGHKLPGLTSVRAIAAWWVVLFHTKEQLTPLLPVWTLRVIGSGYIGVDLFFILSGFVIELNYGDRLAGGVRAWAEFLKRRFARIYPLHFAVLCAMAVYALLIYAHSKHLTANFDFSTLPAHFLLVQSWGVDSALRWNDPAWSISAEMMAYLLFPLTAVGARPRLWPIQVGLLSIVALISLLWLGFRLAGLRDIGQGVMSVGLLRCLIEFTIGIVLCGIFLARRDRVGHRIPVALIGGAVGVAVAGVALGISDLISVPLVFSLLILGLAFAGARGRTILDVAPLVYLGDISYSTYLSHFFLLVVVKSFQTAGARISPGWLVAYFAVVAVASVLLYDFVEVPAQRVLLEHMGLVRRRADGLVAP